MRPTIIAGVLSLAAAACSTAPDFDLIVRGGTLHDGTGEAANVRRADVGIKGDRIVAIGDLSARSAPDVIDATGKIVSPGFIDVQSRSGVALLADGNGESHLRQGITSEILGGSSPALWTAATADTATLQRYGVTFDWSGLNGYFTKLESRGTAINVGTMVPLSIAHAAGDRSVFIDAAIRDGAFGVVDDVDADLQELTAVAAVVGRDEGLLMTKVESPLGSSDEALQMVGPQAHRIVLTGLSRMPPDGSLFQLVRRMVSAGQRNVFMSGTLTPYPAAPGGADTVLRDALKFGSVMIGTDTSAATTGTAPPGTHPGGFGAFPRLLGTLARDDRVIELRDAIRRNTSMAASVFQIPQRGIIRETYFADLVVFDERAIAGRATFEKPNQYPAGIEYVIVNGVVTLTPKGLTGSRPGSRLVHGAATR